MATPLKSKNWMAGTFVGQRQREGEAALLSALEPVSFFLS